MTSFEWPSREASVPTSTPGAKGLYYRKHLGSPGNNSGGDSELSVAAVMAIWLVILTVGAIVGALLWFGVWAILR